MSRQSRDHRGVAGIVLAVLAALALAAAGSGLVVRRLARSQALDEAEAAAERAGGGDGVAALIALAGAPDQPLRRRTRAVWALGELRDERALPALERLRVQEECDHDRLVCQREVRLAIAKIRGELTLRASLGRAWRAVRERAARGARGGASGARDAGERSVRHGS